jgi:hypothetical protein
MAKKVSASEVERQLSVFHDPFSRATRHPKIPDGTTPFSFGFSSSVVGELKNTTSSDEVHILLFAGQRSSMLVKSSNLSDTTSRGYHIPGYTDVGGVDWSALATSTGSEVVAVDPVDKVGGWRVVSTGLQLKLISPSEEDDGWWEAVRLNEVFQPEQYFFTTVNDDTASGCNQYSGILAPNFFLSIPDDTDISTASLQDQPSYSSGMIRDLHNVQFQLNGSLYKERWSKQTLGEHNVIVPSSNPTTGTNKDQCLMSAVDYETDGQTLVNQHIDQNYDMIYIRLHCRSNSGTSPFLGSRFHYNCVTNQEYIYDKDEKNSRFMTRTENLGPMGMDAHTQLRSLNQSAATLVNL